MIIKDGPPLGIQRSSNAYTYAPDVLELVISRHKKHIAELENELQKKRGIIRSLRKKLKAMRKRS
jgi:hypothetical protein